MKRVRELSVGEEEEDGGRAPEKANQFDRWMIRKIYGYAKVRDSKELARLTKKFKRVCDDYEALRQFACEVVHYNDFELYPNFCSECGKTCLKESRTVCGRCYSSYAPCTQCVPRFCASKRHLLCNDCVKEEEEDEDDVVCNGLYASDCDFEQ